MKSIKSALLLCFALGSTLLTSCGDDITNNYNTYEIENVTVSLDAQALITSAESPFQAKGIAFDSTYVHQMPTSYNAYFVADETRGQYTQGQVVKTITVNSGMNSVTVPKIKTKVYVTNYLKPNGNENQPNAWYTWNDAIQQLPQTSTTLNLYGFSSIDYSTVKVGTVTLTNPYAAVMIKKNQWVNGIPKSYATSENYFLDNATNWYILYIRNNNTNTEIPISIPGNPNQTYKLSKSITANKIYQYEINGNVGDVDGNLNIVVAPLEQGVAEQIDL